MSQPAGSMEQSRRPRRFLRTATVALAALVAACGRGEEHRGQSLRAEASGRSRAQATVPCRTESKGTLATYKFESAGWATFGLALPAGAACGVKVGELATQTDVKRRWPDGSVRFAVVTAKIASPGEFPIQPVAPSSSVQSPGSESPFRSPGSESPFRVAVQSPGSESQFRVAQVTLTIDGTPWVAVPRPAATADAWLTGPLVSEQRLVVAPEANGRQHPFLRVLFDLRSYADGGQRVDTTVENVLDVPEARDATYDVTIAVAGKQVYEHRAVRQPYMTRWRQVFATGMKEATVIPDLSTAVRAKAIPDYLPTIEPGNQSPEGPTYDILGSASLMIDMRSHGGRPELAPYPDFTARYLAHPNPTQRRFVLAHGDLGGSFPMHLREPDGGPFEGVGRGRFVSIDERNTFWMDSRAPKAQQPAGTDTGGPLIPDNAHVPSLAYVPYLLTGDRYYADEMTFWVNYAFLRTIPDENSGGFTCRGETATGSRGLLRCNEPRGIAWVLRNMADAAAWLPDDDPAVDYIGDKVLNNLEDLDTLVTRDPTPLGTPFYTWMRGTQRADGSRTVGIATWENNYIAWAIDHANDQGFAGGRKLRDLLAGWQVGLFTAGDEFPREYAANSTYIVGTLVDPAQLTGPVKFFPRLRDIYEQSGLVGTKATAWSGYYGVDARLMLMIGMREGWAGAREGYEYVHGQITADLAKRAGWAIAPPPIADAHTEGAR